jgi:hypothetical protein
MKNWLPLVFFPELAIDRMPAPVCFSSLVISSSNLPLQDNGEERGRDARRQPPRVTTASTQTFGNALVPIDGLAAPSGASGISALAHEILEIKGKR